MALTCDWPTKVITVPKSDLTLVSGTRYTITVDYWFQLLRELNATEVGMAETVTGPLYRNTPPTSSTPRIVEVINGYTVQFEDGLYSVEFINGNTNIRDVEIKNQVSVGTNNTTGFINPVFLETGMFIGKEGLVIAVDPVNGFDGSGYTESGGVIGTKEYPCKTEANISAIETKRNIKNVYVLESITLTGTYQETRTWFGASPQYVTITLDQAGTFTNNKFQDCHIEGALTSGNIIWECVVGSVTNANGFIYKSTLVGPIVLSGSENCNISKCWIAPTAPGLEVDVDFNGQATSCIITQWEGGMINVKNMVPGSVFSVSGTAGAFKIDSTCTGGTINYAGAIHIKEQTGTVDSINDASTATQVLTNAQATPIHSDLRKVTDQPIRGSGTKVDPWGP